MPEQPRTFLIGQLHPSKRPRGVRRLFSIAVMSSCLVLAACAHANPEAVSPADSQLVMTIAATTTAQGKNAMQPKLTAEQALLRLLELIRTSKTIADFTSDRLSNAMGVPITPRERSGYGFGEALTPQWSHGFIVPKAFDPSQKDGGTFFMYAFSEDGSAPPMTDVCQIDFDRFTAELEAMGFSRTSHYDNLPPWSGPDPRPTEEQGRWMYDSFQRPGMRIEVYPEGEANEPIEKIRHHCVKQVFIR